MPELNENKKILDEYFNETIKKARRDIKRDKFLYKFKRFKNFFIGLGILFFISASIWTAVFIFSKSPIYSDEETEISEQRFNALIEQTCEFKKKFI